MPDAATGRSEPHAPGGRSGGREHRPGSEHAGRASIIGVAAGVVTLGMLAFESVKCLISPGVASWHSPWLTISLST